MDQSLACWAKEMLCWSPSPNYCEPHWSHCNVGGPAPVAGDEAALRGQSIMPSTNRILPAQCYSILARQTNQLYVIFSRLRASSSFSDSSNRATGAILVLVCQRFDPIRRTSSAHSSLRHGYSFHPNTDPSSKVLIPREVGCNSTVRPLCVMVSVGHTLRQLDAFY